MCPKISQELRDHPFIVRRHEKPVTIFFFFSQFCEVSVGYVIFNSMMIERKIYTYGTLLHNLSSYYISIKIQNIPSWHSNFLRFSGCDLSAISNPHNDMLDYSGFLKDIIQ